MFRRINPRICVPPCVVVIGLMMGPIKARGDLLVNGDFETYATSGAGITPGVGQAPPFGLFYTYSAGASGLSGWTVLGQSIDVNTAPYWQPAAGGSSLDLVGTSGTSTPQLGGVSQTVTGLTVGSQYKLDFFQSANPFDDQYSDRAKPKILDVAISDASSNVLPVTPSGAFVMLGNNHVEYTTSSLTRSFTDMQWVEESVLFTAPTTTITVQFSAVGTEVLAGPALDNATLTQVPEPASASAALIGVSALLLRRRRRQTLHQC
jgi:hypothetical protein